MKLFNFFVLMVLGLSIVSMTSCGSADISKTKLAETEVDSASYGMGIVFAKNFPKATFPDLNVAALAKGFMDSRDSATLMDEEAAQKVAFAYVNRIQAEAKQKEQEEQAAKYAGNQQAQADFIAATTAKEGVTTTATGLMYEVVKKGSGAKPTATDQVKVHYKGTHLNGEEFDSSYKTGQPAVFGLNQVIPGWTEGIALMSPGAQYKFYIPSNLAYGDAGGRMPPYSLLTFEVELLEVNPKAAPASK